MTLDVFTDVRFGGDPLAVFPDAAGPDGARMQALARDFDPSETTFVPPPESPANTARVCLFTPQAELSFAGHPDAGTGWVLAGAERAPDGVRAWVGGGCVPVLRGGAGVTAGPAHAGPCRRRGRRQRPNRRA